MPFLSRSLPASASARVMEESLFDFSDEHHRPTMTAQTANSTRTAQRFAALRERGELGIVAYITAGDPSLDATLKFVI
ncbi:MAG: hypothetical protein JO119_01030, partial [Acidobacteria bacterium]|nr:hypothetical protein [Acidobacteriota bacterium]